MSIHANTTLAEHTSEEDNSSHLNVPGATRVVITGFGKILHSTSTKRYRLLSPFIETGSHKSLPWSAILNLYMSPMKTSFESSLRFMTNMPVNLITPP
ncbi:hypothetical protein FRC18_007352 [Serendipita sp. 400]|nr:hypothetical protein FRC18_007352 [Serendipita sp. 400]